jgi:hypothetical protein
MIIDMVDLKLSTIRGLLGRVFPALRAVCINSTENLIQIYFYCDGEITNDKKKMCSSVLDQIVVDFDHLTQNENRLRFEAPVIRLDYPNKMPLTGSWIYYRYEDSSKYV